MLSHPIRKRQLPSREACLAHLAEFPALAPESRADTMAVLLRSGSGDIRRRTLAIAAAVVSDQELVSYLRRRADDMLRNAGLEILKLRGRQSLPLAVSLLDDEDPDVVLQAVLLIDHCGDPTCLEALRRVLAHPRANVVQAAISAVGRLGDSRAVDDLLPFLDRETWLQMAAVHALGSLRSERSLDGLEPLLGDDFIAPLAAEAIARIGGKRALTILTNRWSEAAVGDDAVPLGLLGHVAAGLDQPAKLTSPVRFAVAESLASDDPAERTAAAVTLLATGPGVGDLRSVAVLVRAADTATPLPRCLRHRADLIPHLLLLAPTARRWGLELAAGEPARVEIDDLAVALTAGCGASPLAAVAAILEARPEPALALPALGYFLSLPPHQRDGLVAALQRHRETIENRLADLGDLAARDRLAVAAVLGHPAEEIVDRVNDPVLEHRHQTIAQLVSRADVLARLPWQEWLESSFDEACFSLAAAVSGSGAVALLPVLRSALATRPQPAVIRALGELRDQASVEALITHLGDPSPMVRALILDALGQIGGADARQALKAHAGGAEPKEAHVALRSLAHCATDEDAACFRSAAADPDPCIRRTCAEALARFTDAHSRSALLRLAADPEASVANPAVAALGVAGVGQ